MGLHPVQVTLERVDLTVMRQHAERLCQPPLREGVRGITLVINRKRTLEPLVHQVGIKLRHLLRQHHALIDDRAAGHRRNIQRRHLRRDRRLLDAATDHIQLTLERLLIHTLGVGNQNLLDLGPRRIGLLAQTLNLHWHMAPAIDVVTHAQNFGLDNRATCFLSGKIRARQKHLPHGQHLVHARRVPRTLHLIVKERHRDLHVDTRAIACLTISIDRPAVPDRFQRLDPVLDHVARPRPVNVHDKANTTG